MSDVKIFRKLALQLQSSSSYEDSAMFLMPFSSETMNQNIDPIEDDSILGNGFMDIPLQGPVHTGGPIVQNLDVISCLPLLEAAMGSESSGVFTFSNHALKLSVCALNSVSANQYANAYIKRLKISASVSGLVKLEYELFGTTALVRAATSAFPAAPTAPDTPFTFHEAGGTYGYFRVGDAADALTSGDDQSIEEFSIEVTGGFDEQFDNVLRTSKIPVYGMTPFKVSGSFKLSRHLSNTPLSWSDNLTPLQADIKIAKSATEYVQIEVPRFIIKATLTEDDLTRVQCDMTNIGRNGVGTSYKNTNMSFTSPFRVTVVNT